MPVPPGRVHATYWWIVENGTYLGAITLRHELNDFLLRSGGHIGYGIRPSARVIEKAGGVLEDVRDTELGSTRRYWITL